LFAAADISLDSVQQNTVYQTEELKRIQVDSVANKSAQYKQHG